MRAKLSKVIIAQEMLQVFLLEPVDCGEVKAKIGPGDLMNNQSQDWLTSGEHFHIAPLFWHNSLGVNAYISREISEQKWLPDWPTLAQYDRTSLGLTDNTIGT